MRVDGYAMLPNFSFGQAMGTFAGQNVGARRLDRARRVTKDVMFDVFVTGLVLGGLSYLFSHQLLSIYIPGDASAIAYGRLRMKYLCLPYFLDGMMDVMTGVLRGLGSSLLPMIITVFNICVFRIVWIYTIWQVPQFHTLDMLYVTYPISWILTLTLLLVCYFITMRRRAREFGDAETKLAESNL